MTPPAVAGDFVVVPLNRREREVTIPVVRDQCQGYVSNVAAC